MLQDTSPSIEYISKRAHMLGNDKKGDIVVLIVSPQSFWLAAFVFDVVPLQPRKPEQAVLR